MPLNSHDNAVASGPTRRESIAASTLWLTSLQYSTMALNAVLAICAARWLGTRGFGLYTAAMTFVFLARIIAQFGLLRLVIRDVAQAPDRAGDYIASALLLVSLFGLSAWAVIAAVSWLLHYPAMIQHLVLLAGAILVLGAPGMVGDSIFRAHRQMRIPSTIRALLALLTVAAGVAALLIGWGPIGLVLVQVAGSALQSLLIWRTMWRSLPIGPLRLDLSLFRPLLRDAWPVAIADMGHTGLSRIDVLMLAPMAGASPTGLYGAAMRVMAVFRAPFLGFHQALIPGMAAAHAGSPDELRALCKRSITAVIVWASPIAVGVLILADPIVGTLFGRPYLEGGAPIALRILGLALLVEALAGPLWAVLFSLRVSFARMLGWLVLPLAANIALNALLIPRYGFVGASWATLIAAALYWPVLLLRLREHVPTALPDPRDLARAALALTFTCALIWLLRGYFVLIPILAGAVVYCVAVPALGLRELEPITRLLRPLLPRKRA